MTEPAPRRRGAQVIRGCFRRKRAPRRHPRAYQDWRFAISSSDEGRRQALGRALERIALHDDPRWPAAAGGDASAAIALTLGRIWTRELVDVRRDLILCALWLSASAGDPASILLLRVMRERIAETDPDARKVKSRA
ncbi:hypothetical protein [Chenggangzhangella methanolivorans]|uniref:Uncharacterized protein n=1 Tax=Chenggangzhangella methanolivorans TaxID=1437009 RepID=A0A9E6RE28_9HYPH|nr:hypothetical protein [Chenggangzhangella methanolivorans]QZN99136.1 hypothetical protein K6K41_20170 [Chenggangzhangella methanolivorans]